MFEEMEQPAPQDSEVQDETLETSQVDEPILDDDTDEPQEKEPVAESDDSEEIDYEGEKYKVPKKLKDAFLRQADYTTKTQTLAQRMQDFEAKQQQFVARQQFQQQHIEGVAKVMAIDEQLAKYQGLDWNAITDADPVQALKLDRQMRELQTQRNQHVQSIEQAQSKSALEQQQATARQRQEALTELSREIKGFGTPEIAKALKETGKASGYKPEELENISDPRAVRLLHKAYLYDQLVAKTKAADPKPAIKPITRVSGASATTTKTLGDPGLSDAEYNRMRREYISKNR